MNGLVDSSRTRRIGLLVGTALVLLMTGTFLIGREQRFWERKVDFEIRFTRTNGLRVSSPVSLTGVDIGAVEEIYFPDDPNSTYITVKVRISGAATPRLRENTVARIRTIGLLGDKYIELSGGSPDHAILAPGAIIPSVDPIDVEALLGEGGDIVTNIVEASNSLKNVFAAIDRGEGLLGQMLRGHEEGTSSIARLRETIEHLERTAAAVERLVTEVQSGRGALGVLLRRGQETERLLTKLERSASSLATVTARIENAQGALPRLVEDREYGQQLLSDLRTTARNLAELAEKANRGQGTLGRLVNDPALYRDAQELVSSARSSWVFGIYRGLRAILPPYGSSAVTASPLEVAPTPEPTPRVSPSPD